jgi:hypothetical protein
MEKEPGGSAYTFTNQGEVGCSQADLYKREYLGLQSRRLAGLTVGLVGD